jgi:hypothetical protein
MANMFGGQSGFGMQFGSPSGGAQPPMTPQAQRRAASEYNRTAYLRNQQADQQELNAARNRFPGVGESQIRLLIQGTRKAQEATAKADYRAAMKANSDAQQQALWADPAYSARWGAERARRRAYSNYAQQKFGGMTPGFMQGDRYAQGWGGY